MSDAQEPSLKRIRGINWWHMALRFGFGALISGIAAVIALAFGARAAGPLLAFPSILPAALTFLQKKDGKDASLSNLSGAVLGALALTGFAAAAFLLATRMEAIVVIAIGLAVWLAIASSLWIVLHSLSPWREADERDRHGSGRRGSSRSLAHG